MEDRSIKILVVDDSPDHRKLMATALMNHHPFYAVEGVASAEQLLKELEGNEYDLVLLDSNLPQEDGLQALEMMNEKGYKVPVVIVTEHGDEKIAVEAMKQGAYEYIGKSGEYLLMLPVIVNHALERVQAEEALRTLLRQWHATFDAISDAVCLVDLEGKILRCNTAMTGFLGKPFNEIIDRNCSELMHGTSGSVEGYPIVRMRKSRRRETSILPRGDRWLNIAVDPLLDKDNSLIGAIHIMSDITDRVRAEQTLRESEERYRTLFEESRDAIYMTTREGVVVDVNQAALELFGYTREEMIGMDVRETYVHPEDRTRFQQEIEQKGSVRDYEVELFKKDGREMDCLLASTVRRTRDGGILEYQGIIRDITERKGAEQQSRLAAVGQLASGIAHDFNNMLTGVIGYADLLQTRPDMPESAQDDLTNIIQQGRRAAQLIRQILDFSRQSITQKRPLDMVPLLKETIKLLERTIPENIHLLLEVESGDHQVSADMAQIQQMIANLAVNARDAMGEGGTLLFRLLQLRLEPEELPPSPEMSAGMWVVLEVSDTGTGMPPEIVQHIFEPFFTTKDPGEGTGLGLAQVYGIVRQHEGHITMESRVGAGTAFTIYLPALISGEEVAEEEVLKEISRGRGEAILVVEDEADVLEVLRRMLERLNYRVLTATNGEEALAVYDAYEQEIALVLADMIMPKMGGTAFFRALRERGSKVKVIVLTGYPLEEESRDLLVEGIVDWIQKPPTLPALAHTVGRALRGNSP